MPSVPVHAAPTMPPDDSAPLRFTSADGERHYAVHVRVPQRTPPPAGFPVVYVLDGAAARRAIQAAPELHDMPVIVVTVAHAHDPEATKAARAYDYTPPAPDGSPIVDPRVPAWRAGGADAFLDLLDTRIRPAVKSRYPVDAGRATLAGHSYGGLCVLHALCSQRGYAAYVSASPSIWWRDEAILREVDALATAPRREPARVHVLVGEHEAWHARAVGVDGTPGSRLGGAPTAPAAQDLAAHLSGVPELAVTFASLAGETHGTMAAAAARTCVRLAADVGG